MKKKIIIIGAAGMLGQELVKVFSADKTYETIGWDVDDLDITKEVELIAKIKKVQPNAVINSAAYNAVDKAEEDEREYELAKKVNGDGPKFLARVCKEINAVFVHYVSDYVFNGEKGEYREADKTNPISNYGLSKELGEKNVLKVGGKYYLIRTSRLFGSPAQTKGAKKSFFEMMLGLVENNKELKVVNDERSCFTYVSDLAKATKNLVDYSCSSSLSRRGLEEDYPYGIYHIVNEGSATWYEALLKLFEIVGIKDVKIIPVGSEEFPRPAKRPRSSVLINTKFPKLRRYEEAVGEWLLKGVIKNDEK